MRNIVYSVLSATCFILVLPVMFGVVLGGFMENGTTTKVEQMFALVLALLNSALIWWMVYEVFIK